ncbi:MAG: hypothetical protein U1E23_00320 [Reyranellaceae bacterium]
MKPVNGGAHALGPWKIDMVFGELVEFLRSKGDNCLAKSEFKVRSYTESITSDGARLHYRGIFDKRTGNLELASSESDPSGMRVAAIKQTGRCVDEDGKTSTGG